jgi:thiamine biosynthesis lipoprotein
LHFELAVMGTVVTFDVFDDGGVPAVAVRRHLELACSILQEVDRVFSLWRPMSPINAFRRGEIDLKDLPEEVTDVLASCMIARTLSGGWFDPWAMPGGVDPTGYVKGWAAQRALGVLARSGVKSAIVNAAGDVASIGDLSAGVPFRVGIADPSSPRTLACVMELQGAVATSGTYERGAHLIDPHTRRAGSRLASASVCGPDLGLADALATALCVGGDDVLERICELEGYEALTIGLDGAMSSTPRFPLTDL